MIEGENCELPEELPTAREWERVESGRMIERLTLRTPDRFLLRTLFGLYPFISGHTVHPGISTASADRFPVPLASV